MARSALHYDQAEELHLLLQQIIDNAPVGIAVVRGPRHVFDAVNPALQKMIPGIPMLGKPFAEVAPQLPEVVAILDRALRTGEPSHYSNMRLKTQRYSNGPFESGWYTFSCVPQHDPTGRIDSILGLVIETTEEVVARRRLELVLRQERQTRLALECAKSRNELLSEASRVLANSLNCKTTLRSFASVIVPRFGDLFVMMLGAETGWLRMFSVISDPEKTKAPLEVEYCWQEKEAPESLLKVMRTGLPLLYTDDAPKDLRRFSGAGSELKSLVIVPLKASNHTFGVVMISSHHETIRYSTTELALAQELAHRCAMTLENIRLYAEAREAIRLRDDFLSIASHELKTPLTSLAMQIQLIQRLIDQDILGKLSKEKATRMLRVTRQQLQRFSTLIDDLLDSSRIGAGRLSLNLETVDLSEVIRGALQGFHVELEKCGCAIRRVGDVPILGRWDRSRIEQIVSNLLTNAMKFGAGKPIEIATHIVGKRARLVIQDQGIGIPIVDQGRVFERFERAASPRSFAGLGLGLYIVCQIVEAHGGAIFVCSEPGHGSAFGLTLPLAA